MNVNYVKRAVSFNESFINRNINKFPVSVAYFNGFNLYFDWKLKQYRQRFMGLALEAIVTLCHCYYGYMIIIIAIKMLRGKKSCEMDIK